VRSTKRALNVDVLTLLTAGSIHCQLVAMIAKPAKTTPADTPGIGRHVQKRAADIQIALAAAHEHECGGRIDDDANTGDDDHRRRGDRARLEEAAEGLQRDRPNRDEKKDGIEQRREDRRAARPRPALSVG